MLLPRPSLTQSVRVGHIAKFGVLWVKLGGRNWNRILGEYLCGEFSLLVSILKDDG